MGFLAVLGTAAVTGFLEFVKQAGILLIAVALMFLVVSMKIEFEGHGSVGNKDSPEEVATPPPEPPPEYNVVPTSSTVVMLDWENLERNLPLLL